MQTTKPSESIRETRESLPSVLIPANTSLADGAALDSLERNNTLRIIASESEFSPKPLGPNQRAKLSQQFARVVTSVCESEAKKAFLQAAKNPFQYVEVFGLSIDAPTAAPHIIMPNSPAYLYQALAQSMAHKEATLVFSFAVYNGKEALGQTHSFRGTIASEEQGAIDVIHPWKNIFIPSENNPAQKSLAQIESECLQSDTALSTSSPRSTAVTFLSSNTLKLPSLPQSIELEPVLLKRFAQDRKNPFQADQWKLCYELAHEQIEVFKERFTRNAAINIEFLRDIGEATNAHKESKLKGRPALLPDALLLEAFATRLAHMQHFNNPVRLEAQSRMEDRGYVPIISKHMPVLQQNELTALSFEDLTGTIAPTPSEDDSDQRTTKALASGLFSFVNDRFTANYVNGSSMMAYSPFGAATLGLIGSTCYFPRDARWSNPEAREFYRQHVAHLIDNDPGLRLQLFDNSDLLPHWTPSRVTEYLRQRAYRNLGPTLKIENLDEAVNEALECRAMGFRSLRVYDPRATSRMIALVEKLREQKELDDMTIAAGRVVDPETAHRLHAAGANSVEVGIADGSICLTSKSADIVGENVRTLFRITQSGLAIPANLEGGVGSKYGVLAAAGGASSHATGKIIGGAVEQAPVLFYRQTPNGERQAKDYPGEACEDTKTEGGNVDALEEPINVEGENGYTEYNHYNSSGVKAMWKTLEGIAKAELFQRVTSIEAMTHKIAPEGIKKIGAGAKQSAQAHGPGARAGRPPSLAELTTRAEQRALRRTGLSALPTSTITVTHPELTYEW